MKFKNKMKDSCVFYEKEKVRAILLDYFNGDDIKVKRMMKGYDAGIKNINFNKNLSEIEYNRILYKLIDDEDIVENKAKAIIDSWLNLYGISVECTDKEIIKTENINNKKNQKNIRSKKQASVETDIDETKQMRDVSSRPASIFRAIRFNYFTILFGTILILFWLVLVPMGEYVAALKMTIGLLFLWFVLHLFF